jgi:YHS domain-containing protein
MKFTKSILLVFIVVACTKSNEIYTGENGLAINGYDPIAYFVMQKPVKGDAQYQYEWNDTRWQFASMENLNLFKGDPEKYAPQYGGYCAFGLSNGYKAPTDPEAWTIVDEKLYLNYNKDVRADWLPKSENLIHKADSNWVTVKYK